MERTISHYEILARIGEGGMGVVYKARDVRLGRVVALKFLPARLAESETLSARFEDEARAISALNHPNIATIYEMNEEGEDRFLALEYLPGGTLFTLLRQRKTAGEMLPFETILEYACQIAEGLAHAHSHGIIHRDIKADNVMLTAEGTLKITDFGLAKLRDGSGHTATGQTVGTAAYMSPEQAFGKEVDQRTDIFSYGVLLHHLATLELPFQGQSAMAVMQEICSREAPAVTLHRTDLPAAFQRVIDKALVKDRAARYQNMEEVLRDLQEVAGGKISVRVISRVTEESPTLTIVSPLSAGWRKRIRKRRTLLWGATAMLGVAIVIGGLTWNRTSLRHTEQHIAVLPFVNIGGDREMQALCDGLAETLTASLGQLQRFGDTLWVIPASEIRQQPVSNPAAAQQVFGATLVVTGSLQKNGDRLRLIATLVDPGKRKQIASRTIDATVANFTEIQDTMANAVVEMLAIDLNPEMRRALAAGRTTVSGAYEAYAKGLGYLQGRRAEDLALASGLFEVAVQKDSTYALAYAGLGSANLVRYSFVHDQQFIENARRACQRALDLNPQLPEVRLAMAQLFNQTGKFDEAVRELNGLIAIDRTAADAYFLLGRTYDDMGRNAEAESILKKAIQLRPGYWAGYNTLGRFYVRHGRYEEAEQNFRMVTTLTPDNVMGYNNLGGLYNMWGHYVEAVAALEKSLALKPSGPAYSNLGTILYFMGRYDEAVTQMAKAVEMVPTRYTFWGNYGDACRWSNKSRHKAEAAYRQAIALVEKELAVHPNDSMLLASEALYYAKLGEMAPALAGIGRALQQKPLDVAAHFKAGIVYELAGQRDRALAELQSALKAGYSSEEITKERELERMRSDSRFQKLIAEAAPAPTPKK